MLCGVLVLIVVLNESVGCLLIDCIGVVGLWYCVYDVWNSVVFCCVVGVVVVCLIVFVVVVVCVCVGFWIDRM